MSEILSREQRERLAQYPAPKKPTRLDAFGKAVGFVAGLVLVLLLVAGAAGFVAWIWRAAVR